MDHAEKHFRPPPQATEEPLIPGTVVISGGYAYIRDNDPPGAVSWYRMLEWFAWDDVVEADPDRHVLVLHIPGRMQW